MSADKQEVPSHPPEFPWPQPNGVYATYQLHCHCGAIRFNIKLSPPLYQEQTGGKEQYVAVECNCSHCEAKGIITVYPLADDVEFTHGLEERVKYYTASKKNPHWFCRQCGCTVGTDLTYVMQVSGLENRCGINARMLKDFDRNKLKIRQLTFMKDAGPKNED